MSIAAAQAFIRAVKATRAEFDKETAEFYKKFIAGRETPTASDAKELAELVKKMEQTAAVYQGEVVNAIRGFGGTSDSDIKNARVLLQAIVKKAQK